MMSEPYLVALFHHYKIIFIILNSMLDFFKYDNIKLFCLKIHNSIHCEHFPAT